MTRPTGGGEVQRRPEAADLLDPSTQLGGSPTDQKAGWKFTNWPECSEASLAWVTPPQPSGAPRRRPKRSTSTDRDQDVAPIGAMRMTRDGELYRDESWTMRGDLDAVEDQWEADRQAAKWKQSNGRAVTKSRRYFVANRLRFMWVLTFAVEHRDRGEVMGLVSEFARRLRSALDGRAFPYWYSPELHLGGHGWHVNFFIPMYVQHPVVEALWGFGFVWVTDYATARRAARGEPLGMCSSPREGWRRAARYGCKYSQKDWSPEHVGATNHRYEVAQGFAPKKASQWVTGPGEADRLAEALVPQEDRRHLSVWDSNDAPDWDRPPVKTWQW